MLFIKLNNNKNVVLKRVIKERLKTYKKFDSSRDLYKKYKNYQKFELNGLTQFFRFKLNRNFTDNYIII
jgi:hypothetical protein